MDKRRDAPIGALDPNAALDSDGVQAFTGFGKPTIYQGRRCGHLRGFYAAKKWRTRVRDVIAWLDFLQEQSDAGKPVVYQARDLNRRPKPALP